MKMVESSDKENITVLYDNCRIRVRTRVWVNYGVVSSDVLSRS